MDLKPFKKNYSGKKNVVVTNSTQKVLILDFFST